MISNLKVNHLSNPKFLDINELSFSFLCNKNIQEFEAFLSKKSDFSEIIETKKIAYCDRFGFSFDTKFEYNEKYFWKVVCKNEESEIQLFETAPILDGNYIGLPKDFPNDTCPVFVKTFDLKKKISRALLSITGLGLYEAYINGNRIGNSYLNPGYNDYDDYLRYQTYDVTNQLSSNNTLEVYIGFGWYKGVFGFSNDGCLYGSDFLMKSSLLLYFEDGTVEKINSNNSFKCRVSEHIKNGIYYGEDIDYSVNKDKLFDVVELNKDYKLKAYNNNLVEIYEERIPVIINTKDGPILDFGQNSSGIIEFKDTLKKGESITISTGEVLKKGTFFNKNYRAARSQLHFVSDGQQRLIREKFTFHGFRYLKVEGPIELKPENFKFLMLSSNNEKTLEFSTDHDCLNKLISNVLYSQKSNFIDLPTDCPQRNERLGWTGDAQVFCNTANFHSDAEMFFDKYLKDIRREQVTRYEGRIPGTAPSLKEYPGNPGGAIWEDAATIIPINLYRIYGDKVRLNSYFDMMRDYVDTLLNDVKKNGKYIFDHGHCFGDWLSLDVQTPFFNWGGTDKVFLQAIYLYYSLLNTKKAAEILDKSDDKEKYEKHLISLKNNILNEYYTPNGRCSVGTQTAYLLSIYFGFGNKEVVLKQLIDNLEKNLFKLQTGFCGTPFLLKILFENNFDDIAYRILFNKKYPGWLYQVLQGSTTMWERWNSLDMIYADDVFDDMNSFNHYSYGSVCESIYKYLGGLKPLAPGFEKILIKPHLTHHVRKVNLKYESVSGPIVINYEINDQNILNMHVEIPDTIEAIVDVPEDREYVLNGGVFDFKVNLKKNYVYPYNENSVCFDLLERDNTNKVLMSNFATKNCHYDWPFSLWTIKERLTNENNLDQLDELKEKLSKIPYIF